MLREFHHLKILKAIIVTISVLVMNNFIAIKFSSKMFFHEESMFVLACPVGKLDLFVSALQFWRSRWVSIPLPSP